ncbi:MAG: DUF547 domain-containing protein [Planctomycetota bacterium]
MFVAWIFALVLGWVAAVTPAQEPKATEFGEVDHSEWDAILREVVRDERVDYLAVRTAHWKALESYLDRMAKIDVSDLDEKERLAFYINLYNATMVHTIAKRWEPGYSVSEKDFGVFKEPLVRLKTGKITLDHLEHEILRPKFQDARIHVAIVCGARSCPPLIPRAYSPVDLSEVLEANFRRFLHDSFRNEVDEKKGVLRLSKIFEWFADDFGGAEELPHYLAHYHPGITDEQKITFKEYDWSLNIAEPKEGRFVVLTQAASVFGAPSGGDDLGQASSKEVVEVIGEEGDRLHVRRPLGRGEGWIPKSATKAYER